MKVIQKITDMINDEIEGAKEYAKCSVKYKEENPSLAKVFYDIAEQELRHVDMLHGEVVKIIKEHREKVGQPPSDMMAIYNYLHEKQIKKAGEVKALQNLYG